MNAPALVCACFVCACLASLGFMAAYALDASIQWQGALLGVAFAALGGGLALWSKRVMAPEEVTEGRVAFASPPEVREAALEELVCGEHAIARQRVLLSLAAAAAGTCGVALLFPIRSLGSAVGDVLAHTTWRPGARAVTPDGVPVKAQDVVPGSVQTVFPEGHVGDGNAATLLIRLDPAALRLPPQRAAWAPGGLIGFSKICTHAGCPIGLYRTQTQELFCPCHQSTFDVLQGARVVFGPAPRALPQLPLEVGSDGYVRARADFPEPVGPDFWEGRYS